MQYKIRFWVNARDIDRETSRIEVKECKDVISMINKQFSNDLLDFTSIYEAYGKRNMLRGAYAYTSNLSLFVTAHQWCQSVTKESKVEAGAEPWLDYNDPQIIARSRWVDFDVCLPPRRGEAIKSPEYKIACTECGEFDWESIPSPYIIDDDILKYPKLEIFDQINGIVIVNNRVLDILKRFVPNEIHYGPAMIRGLKKGESAFNWVRPKHWIGDSAWVGSEDPCPKCGIPRKIVSLANKFPRKPNIVSSFGDAKWNIAKVGSKSMVRTRWKRPSSGSGSLSLVISGGLFAVLFNEKVSGLRWPSDIPYFCVDPHYPSIEDRRRFSDIFTADHDIISKGPIKGK
jgi:hypothetical protein